MCKRVLWLRLCRTVERFWRFVKSGPFLGFVLGVMFGFYLFAVVTIWEGARSRFYGDQSRGVIRTPVAAKGKE